MKECYREWGRPFRHCSTSRRSRTRFAIVSLGFFVDLTLSTSLRPWGRLI